MQPSKQESDVSVVQFLNRWSIGVFSVFQMLLLVVILLVANYLALQYFMRWDLSRSKDYTLSSSTRHYLKSDTLRQREQKVKWVLAMPRTSPFYERVRILAEEYQRVSKGKIELEVVDPMRSPDRMQALAAAYGISFIRGLLIMDARTDGRPAVIEDAQKVRTLHPKVKLVVTDDLGVHELVEGERKITAFQGEDVLTANLVEAIEGKPKKVAILLDKSRIEDTSDETPLKAFAEIVKFQNIELSGISLSGLAEIPADVSGLAMVAPKYDFSESEMAVLEKYWNRPRSAILVMLKGADVPPRLRAFLRTKGVTPRKDRLVAREGKQLVTAARGVFAKGVPFIADLAGQSTEWGGESSSLEVREDAEDLLNRQIRPVALIDVAQGFWGETRFGQGDEVFNDQEDHALPLAVAAAVTRGAESNDQFAASSSRMLVMSNMDFLSPKHHRAENLDFLASSLNWLVDRESLAGIGPHSLRTYKLPLLDAQITFINRVNLFFLPAFLLLVGLFVWSSRRV